jgi:hypothetical protein
VRIAVIAGVLAIAAAAFAVQPAPAWAHVAERAHWSERYAELEQLFPTADPEGWRSVEYRVSRKEARELERRLGFGLEPEDLTPMFFIAHGDDGRLLGVAMFVRPHGGGYSHATFEVGVAVDPAGRIATLSVSRAPVPELGAGAFVDQLRGRSLASAFEVGSDDLRPVPDHAHQSQLVASAAKEALLFMKLALGRDA